MEMIKSRLVIWMRWFLMPAAAIAGGGLAAWVASKPMWLFMKMTGEVYNENGWYYKYIIPIMVYAAFGYIYTVISYHVSPSGKLVAGSVMVAVLGIVLILFGINVWTAERVQTSDAIWITLRYVGALFAAMGVLMNQDE